MTEFDSPRPVEISRGLGWLLVSGATIFWVGAVTPPYRQWTGVPLDEYLRIVQGHPLNWLLIHGCFAAGTVLTLIGISGLNASLGSASARGWNGAGATLFSVGATLWLICIAHRVSMTVDAAAELVNTGRIPPGYAATHQWVGYLFGIFMLLSYLAIAALGAALLATRALRPWAGRTALVFGALGVPGLATPVFQPPLMIFVAPFVLGIAILRAPREG